MNRFIKVIPQVSLLILITFFYSPVSIASEYPSVPKGITLEGWADGIGIINELHYNKSSNTFIINNHLKLDNPIKAKEFAYLIDVLQADRLFGISVIGGTKAIYYGSWSGEGAGYSISKKLYEADEFFRGVVFGIPSLYKMYKLPGRYKPQKPFNREYHSAVWFNLRHFRYKLENDEYRYKGCNIQVKLLAVENNDEVKAADGGYQLDPNGETHVEDRDNIASIKANAKGYLNIKVARPMVEYGKAAALIRLFLDQSLDMRSLKAELK